MNPGSSFVIVCETVEVVEEQVDLSLMELCRSLGAEPPRAADLVVELVAYGLLEPAGTGPDSWRFGGNSLALTRRAQRLIDDLGVNAAGAAVAIELLERIERLERLEPDRRR